MVFRTGLSLLTKVPYIEMIQQKKDRKSILNMVVGKTKKQFPRFQTLQSQHYLLQFA